jgi:hypothetical protein
MSGGGAAGEADGFDPIAAVEAWRERGAAQVDPVGFGVIEALARRAGAQQDEARQLLTRRVEDLLAEHAALKPRGATSAAAEAEARRAVLTGLSELVDRLGRSPTSSLPSPSPPGPGAARRTEAQQIASLSDPEPPASLTAVTAFKGTWSRLRADQRLRQALAQVPASAGPLNSSQVVNRALQAMRELAPAYLDAFMAHVDTLLWLEQASGGGDLMPRPPPPADGRRGPGARPRVTRARSRRP